MALSSTIANRREAILMLAARHGASNVRVFGSMARGDDDDESDADFLVESGPDRSPFFPGGLVVDLEELLGCKVDVVTERALHRTIREQILKEAIAL